MRLPSSVQTRLFLRAGEPAAEIVRFAAEQESDLIVLAWHGSLAGERAATLEGGHPRCLVPGLRREGADGVVEGSSGRAEEDTAGSGTA